MNGQCPEPQNGGEVDKNIDRQPKQREDETDSRIEALLQKLRHGLNIVF